MPAYCKSGMEIFLLLACLFVGTGGHNETAVKCQGRESLDECLKQLPDILEKKELKGIPSSKKDVDAMCSAFKTGMNCMNSYARECLNPDSRRIMEDHVAGAKHTFSFLCDDPSFQSEYLTYTTCYRGITKDWDSCADRFLALVGEELARKNASRQSRLIELCCAKHGFLKCVYVSARLKCRKEEALFIQKIADTLSSVRVYTPHCSKIDVKSICSGCLKAFPFKENLFFMLFLILKPYISL